MRRLRVATVLIVLVLATLPMSSQQALAHYNCTFSGGINFGGSGMNYTHMQGWAKAACDHTHHDIYAEISLQFKNASGNWVILENSGPFRNCCDVKNWYVSAPLHSAVICPTVQFRVFIHWFNIYSATGNLAHTASIGSIFQHGYGLCPQ
jgi:hypothetical protein